MTLIIIPVSEDSYDHQNSEMVLVSQETKTFGAVNADAMPAENYDKNIILEMVTMMIMKTVMMLKTMMKLLDIVLIRKAWPKEGSRLALRMLTHI